MIIHMFYQYSVGIQLHLTRVYKHFFYIDVHIDGLVQECSNSIAKEKGYWA